MLPRKSVRSLMVAGFVMAFAAVLPALIAPAGALGACPTPSAGELGLNGTFSGGALKLGDHAAAEGVSATVVCGALSTETLRYSIPAANVTYAPFTTKVFGFLRVPTNLTVDQTLEGVLEAHLPGRECECEGYDTKLTTSVTVTVNYFGLAKCSVGPFPLALTTGKSGSLEGRYFEGGLGSLSPGTLVANEFAVPRVHASKACPFFLAWVTNLIFDLPLAPGKASITTTASLKPEGRAPTFAGLQSAEGCHGGPANESSYTLRWAAGSDPLTPQSQIVYDIYEASSAGAENFSTPTYSTPAGATSFTTPVIPGDAFFVVRARDQLGLEDSNVVEKQGVNLCE